MPATTPSRPWGGPLRWFGTTGLIAAVVVAIGARLGPGPALADEGFDPNDARLDEAAALASDLGIPFRAVRFADFAVVSDLPSDRLDVHGATLAEAGSDFFEAMSRLGLETHRPARPLIVVIFSDHREFVAFAQRADGVEAHWMGGYYASGSNHAVMYDDLGGPEFLQAADQGLCPGEVRAQAARATREKIRHEAAHLLAFNCGVQSRTGDHPLWLTEGLAESFARGALSGSPGQSATARHDDDPVRAFYEQSRAAVDAIVHSDPARLAEYLRSARAAFAVGAPAAFDLPRPPGATGDPGAPTVSAVDAGR